MVFLVTLFESDTDVQVVAVECRLWWNEPTKKYDKKKKKHYTEKVVIHPLMFKGKMNPV